jgi:hypothetical protein
MKKLLIALLLIPTIATAQQKYTFSEYLGGFGPGEIAAIDQAYKPSLQGTRPASGSIYVPVPSMVYEMGRGYVPSTGLAQVPGRQLTTPLGTALGFDNVPVSPNSLFNPYGYGK